MTYMKKIEKVLTSGKTTGEILRELKKLMKKHDEEMQDKHFKKQINDWFEEVKQSLADSASIQQQK